MHRYFIAILLPDHAKDVLVALQPAATPGMRLIERSELHLTLHFLGELGLHSVDAVRQALTQLNVSTFDLSIREFGKFPSEGQPRVLWVGVESSPNLVALHHSLGVALREAMVSSPKSALISPHHVGTIQCSRIGQCGRTLLRTARAS